MSNEWYRNEFQHPGADFTDPDVIAAYDKSMARVRDFQAEFASFKDAVQLDRTHRIADIGCGSGELTLRIAGECATVYAVDPSRGMLDHCRNKASAQGLENIRYIQAGFLTYEHDSEPLDAVISCLALHHLPDFWKIVGLSRVRRFLKFKGLLYLHDVVYSFPVEDYAEELDHWTAEMGEQLPAMRSSAARHVRDEYSTTSGIMEQIIHEAGFSILDRNCWGKAFCTYVCQN